MPGGIARHQFLANSGKRARQLVERQAGEEQLGLSRFLIQHSVHNKLSIYRIYRIRRGTRACHCISEAQIAISADMRLTLVERSLKMGNKDRKKDKKKPKKTATKTPSAK